MIENGSGDQLDMGKKHNKVFFLKKHALLTSNYVR